MLAPEEVKCEPKEWLENCLETKRWALRQEPGTAWRALTRRQGWGGGNARPAPGGTDAPGPNMVHKEETGTKMLVTERALTSPQQEVHEDHHTCHDWQDSSEAGNSTRACRGWLLEPPGWLSLLFLSCRIRKPIITNMCHRSSLAARVPRGRAKMMWYHFSQWIFISRPCSTLLIVSPGFFFFFFFFSFMSEAF